MNLMKLLDILNDVMSRLVEIRGAAVFLSRWIQLVLAGNDRK